MLREWKKVHSSGNTRKKSYLVNLSDALEELRNLLGMYFVSFVFLLPVFYQFVYSALWRHSPHINFFQVEKWFFYNNAMCETLGQVGMAIEKQERKTCIVLYLAG